MFLGHKGMCIFGIFQLRGYTDMKINNMLLSIQGFSVCVCTYSYMVLYLSVTLPTFCLYHFKMLLLWSIPSHKTCFELLYFYNVPSKLVQIYNKILRQPIRLRYEIFVLIMDIDVNKVSTFSLKMLHTLIIWGIMRFLDVSFIDIL